MGDLRTVNGGFAPYRLFTWGVDCAPTDGGVHVGGRVVGRWPARSIALPPGWKGAALRMEVPEQNRAVSFY